MNKTYRGHPANRDSERSLRSAGSDGLRTFPNSQIGYRTLGRAHGRHSCCEVLNVAVGQDQTSQGGAREERGETEEEAAAD